MGNGIQPPMIKRKDSDAGKDWRQERRRWQRMRWLDGIRDSMDMSLSKLAQVWTSLSKDREVWWAAVHGVTKSQTWLSNWTMTNPNRKEFLKSIHTHTHTHTYTLQHQQNNILYTLYNSILHFSWKQMRDSRDLPYWQGSPVGPLFSWSFQRWGVPRSLKLCRAWS